MSKLLTVKGTNSGVAYELGERTRLGRLGENEVQISDPNVSRIHAEIVQENDAFVIYDRGSKNGVMVNGVEIAEKRLEPGDELLIGTASFVFDPAYDIQNARFSDNALTVVDSEGSARDRLALESDRGQTAPDNTAALLNRIFGQDTADVPRLSHRMTTEVLEFFKAEHVGVLWRSHKESPMQPYQVAPANEDMCISGRLIAEVADTGLAIAVTAELEASPCKAAESDAIAMMCAPMGSPDGQGVMGLLAVTRSSNAPWTPADLLALQYIASIGGQLLSTAHLITREKGASAAERAETEQRIVSTRSLRMQEIYNSARRSADSMGTILITGESGSGKETLARFIHENGYRVSGPFVTVNCATIAPDVFETELFGYEGQGDNAQQSRPGKVEEAQGGTLFLCEVGELELSLQPKLLRFMQDHAFFRYGGSRAIETDIRVIASTTVDLAAAVRAGKFREDLWYRLNVVPFHMPPLRERREDIGPLVDFFIARHSIALNKKVLGVNDGAIALLQKYDWPGNIRELDNAVQRAVMLAESKVLSISDFSHIEDARRRLNSQADLERKRDTKPLAEVERQHIIIALKKYNFNQARAAEALGLHRNTLRNKIIEYGIEITK